MVDDKRTACIQQMWLLGAICKVSNGKSFNVCYWYLVFSSVVQVTNCWLAHSQLSWKVKLFSCNLIGQLCLSGPGYNSRTVTWSIHQCDYSLIKARYTGERPLKKWPTAHRCKGDVTQDDSPRRFLAQQNVATLFRIVTKLFQHCNAVLRSKSLLRIFPRNITLTIVRCLKELQSYS